MRRPRRPDPLPPPAAGTPVQAAPVDTFREAVAAAKGAEARPRRRQTPYMAAAAILDERDDADSLTPAQLVEAMAGRGVNVGVSTAQALLRELRPPLSSRLPARRPSRAPRVTGTPNGGPPTPRPR